MASFFIFIDGSGSWMESLLLMVIIEGYRKFLKRANVNLFPELGDESFSKKIDVRASTGLPRL